MIKSCLVKTKTLHLLRIGRKKLFKIFFDYAQHFQPKQLQVHHKTFRASHFRRHQDQQAGKYANHFERTEIKARERTAPHD